MKKLMFVLSILFCFCLSTDGFAKSNGHYGHYGNNGYRSNGSNRYRNQLDDVMVTASAINTLGQMFLPRAPVQVQRHCPERVPTGGIPACELSFPAPDFPYPYEYCYQNGREYIRYWKCGHCYYIPNYGLHRNQWQHRRY